MSQISPGLTPANTADITPASSNAAIPLLSARRRRDKVQLSCNLCRRRKLKCDRAQPCGTCIRRGLSLSCTYVTSASGRADRSRAPVGAPGGMQDRITQLEGLVVSLISSLNAVKSTEQTPPADAFNVSGLPSSTVQKEGDGTALSQDPTQLAANLGQISLDYPPASSVESANWTAILDGIGALKDQLEDHPSGFQQQQSTEEQDAPEPDLLFGGHGIAPKQEILSAIPPRPIVDRLVAKCFACMDMAPIIIHRPTFLKEYERFWDNQMETPLMWIGMLFGIMCSAILYQNLSPNKFDPPLYPESTSDPMLLAEIYRAKTIQCTVLRKYNQAVPYTIETLLLYLHALSVSPSDTQTQIWIFLGMTVRIAQRMGYHRDATRYPQFSPFQAEMRRRVWAVITQLEILASDQCGLPRMLRDIHCDTSEPRNLLDEDFDENMVELPPARPDTSFTAVQYLLAKNRVILAFGLINDLEASTRPGSYDEVVGLDAILNEAYESLPHWLLMRPMSQSILDSPDAIIRRISVALLYQKARCVLHRKYVLLARTNSSYTNSRTTCLKAALQILQYQQILDQETQLGGQLHQDRWKISAAANMDFLLAITILCLDLDNDMLETSLLESLESGATGVVVQALTDSHQIWLRSNPLSREAQKASKMLDAVLGKWRNMAARSAATPGENMPDTSLPTGSSPPSQQSTSRLYQGVLAPMMDLYDATPPNINSFLETEAGPFDFVDWDSGYQTQNMDDVGGVSLNYPLMFGFLT